MTALVRCAPWIVAAFCFQVGLAGQVVLAPIKDNSLYSESGSLSNGVGLHLFSGRTAVSTNRRALLAFDVAGAVPAGSTIDAASLTLHLSLSPPGGSADPCSLHRVLSDWGESASAAANPEGMGGAAEPGDATWTHRFFPGATWTAAGGDFALATATVSVPRSSNALVTWVSSAAMISDVQSWLDTPASNFGWIVIGEESVSTTARRFDSLQNPTKANRPALTVQFTPPGGGQGAVPDGDDVPGPPLTVTKAGGGMLALTWGSACVPGTDYAIYEGTLGGTFTTHGILDCSTGGTSATVTPAAGNRYYLVVPQGASVEGSYGRNKSNVERPQGTSTCAPQLLAACPP